MLDITGNSSSKGIKLSLLHEYKATSINYTKMDFTEDFYILELIRYSDWIDLDDILLSDD